MTLSKAGRSPRSCFSTLLTCSALTVPHQASVWRQSTSLSGSQATQGTPFGSLPGSTLNISSACSRNLKDGSSHRGLHPVTCGSPAGTGPTGRDRGGRFDQGSLAPRPGLSSFLGQVRRLPLQAVRNSTLWPTQQDLRLQKPLARVVTG